jgi:hypothetical protein
LTISVLAVAALVVAALWQSATPQSAQAAGPLTSPPHVLILSTTTSGTEAATPALAGFQKDVVAPAAWSTMTATGGGSFANCPGGGCGFNDYRAIILGDPACGSGSPELADIESNLVWGNSVTGNVVIIGTDPVFHFSQGGSTMTDSGIKFAIDDATKTGAYITLSCYYWAGGGGSTLKIGEPMLSGASGSGTGSGLGAGAFDVQGIAGCFNTVRKVANHLALGSLTSAIMSGWNCSVHEAFFAWPASFKPLAIAEGLGTFQPSDLGTTGQPYILARSPQLVPIQPVSVGGFTDVQIGGAPGAGALAAQSGRCRDCGGERRLVPAQAPSTVGLQPIGEGSICDEGAGDHRPLSRGRGLLMTG